MTEFSENAGDLNAGPNQPPTDALVVRDNCWISRSSLEYMFSRSGGPGGQAVNKVNTRVQIRVQIDAIVGLPDRATTRLRRLAGQRLTVNDELLIQSDTHRSQRANRNECESRLRDLISRALVEPKQRRRSRPTRAMIERRLAQKKRQSEKKQRRRSDRAQDDT